MEVIDKSYPGFNAENDRGSKATISFGETFIGITKKAVEEFDIVAGSKIHFVFDLDRLYFYLDDDKNGLCASYHGHTSMGVRIKSKSFSNIIRKKMPLIKIGSRFPLRKSVTRWNGHELIEVLVHKKAK